MGVQTRDAEPCTSSDARHLASRLCGGGLERCGSGADTKEG